MRLEVPTTSTRLCTLTANPCQMLVRVKGVSILLFICIFTLDNEDLLIQGENRVSKSIIERDPSPLISHTFLQIRNNSSNRDERNQTGG
uniref:Uncharacterized protein n=1 Tax=Solanum tuberosum TaxID=4113 RepID=M1AJR6_SOLTU